MRKQPDIRKPSRPDAGLTLLELLVSLALSAVVMGALYAALIGFSKIHTDQTLRTEVEQELRVSFELMARDLNQSGYGLLNNGTTHSQGTIFPNSDPTSNAFTTNSLTIWSWASPSPQTSLLANMTSTTSALQVTSSAGFVATGNNWIIGDCTTGVNTRNKITVTGVTTGAPNTITHSAATNCLQRIGANVLTLTQVSYRLSAVLPAATPPTFLLQREVDASGTWTTIMAGVTDLTITYYNAAGTSISPVLPSTRTSIRRMRISLTGVTAQKLRGSGISDTVTFAADIAPRNQVALGV